MSYIKQYRTEKGGKLPNVPLAAIVTDVKEIMMRTKKHKVANVGTTKQVENALFSHEGAASAANTKIKTVVSEPKNFNAATSEYLNAPTCSAPSSLGSSSSDRMAHPKGKTLNELYTKKQAEATTVTNVEEIMMSTKKKMVANMGTTKQVGNHVLSHQGVASAADTKIKTVVSEPKNFNAATSECISAPTCSAPSGLGSSSSDRMAHPKGKTLNDLYTKNQAEATTVTDVKENVMGTKKKKVTNVRTTKQVENPVFSHRVAASAADTKIKTVVSEPKNFNPATFECLNAPTCSDTAKIQSNLTHFVTDAKKTSTGNNRAQRDTRNETLINSASTKSALKRCDNGPRKGSSRSASKDMKTDPQIILTYPKSSQPKKLSNKTLTSCSKPKQPPKDEQKKQSICPWAKVLNPDNKSNGDFVSSEQYCCICFELMTVLNTRTTDCGHKFHFKCIKEWCDKQSDCPICRAHLLLSEDFPVLS